MSTGRRHQYYIVGTDYFYLACAAIVIVSYVVEAPLRYCLGVVGLGALIYARDGIDALCVGCVLLSWLLGQRTASLMVAVCCVLCVHTLVGVITLPSALQPLVGLKTFMPGLMGLCVAPLVFSRPSALIRFSAYCYGVTALGVLLNYWMEFPWVGLSSSGPLGQELELSKQWWATDGSLRLPGFTRASILAAQYMLVSVVPLLAVATRPLVRLGLIAVAAGTIMLTTTKGALTGLALIALCDALIRSPNLAGLISPVLMGTGMFGLGLPLIGIQLGRATGPVPGWANSFMERIGDMWPRALELYDGPWSVLFGRGLGGIGVGQLVGESARFNAADNFIVYILVCFGLPGLFYVGLLLTRFAVQLRLARRELSTRCSAGVLAMLLGVGLTSDVVQEGVSILVVFAMFGLLLASQRRAVLAANPQRGSHASEAMRYVRLSL